MSDRIVRIGGASGFWGDSAVGAPQLVRHGQIDYLVFDYLAELTMSILATMRSKSPDQGYATDFVDIAMRAVIRDVAAKGIKVLSNAGGVNPRACAAALAKLADEAGVTLKIAVVEGDDLLPRTDALRAGGMTEMFTGAPMPDKLMSANAYLGALPVKVALDAGADVVITGRSADSALALGALMHEFRWTADDYDRLAAGSLVGHILECGCQATGGLHTDWDLVPDWAGIGYPITECAADGSFVVTKAPETGGLVVPAVVAEQMLYEVGDPAAYLLPDVICDFTAVTMETAGPDRVLVQGTRGHAPTDSYKASATYMDGWRAVAQLTIIGIDAAAKAQRTADAILERTRQMLRHSNLPDYRATHTEILGAESMYGPHGRAFGAREVVMRLAVTHDDRKALAMFAREIAPAGTSWSPGTTGAGGRPKPSPIVRLFSFLMPKADVQVTVTLGGKTMPVAIPAGSAGGGAALQAPEPMPAADPVAADAAAAMVGVPLVSLAYARSGDKGDSSNIGIIARDPGFLPLLRRDLTPARVQAYFAHLLAADSTVARFEVPGVNAVNFLLTRALGGGGMASLRNDPLGKGFGQMLLDMVVDVPADWLDHPKLRKPAA
ncbi:hypothetical protein GCM10011505_31680 [Tistrella bauzanensis]|uniref:Terpene utilization protein AtuA n=1 Tax=Tistrella bauzanensis TaxID=657419 RepID=A0ABQ1IPL6_9PROT|nr:acyclic terpene utilization AtuA family protein [Tistrella bauzanensis]GGB48308.1 hypothetical protein GCM10011505_31680 [Tistrella bauzanensis]